jgi:hypothetical protein
VLALVLPLSLAGGSNWGGSSGRVTFQYIPQGVPSNCAAKASASESANQIARLRSLMAKLRQAKSRQEADRLLLQLACFADRNNAHLFGIGSAAAEIIPHVSGQSTIIIPKEPPSAGMH